MAKVDREKLRQLVTESGKSARHHSLQAGLGATAIKDILSGKSVRPSYDTISRVASQLGAPPDSFASGEADDADRGSADRNLKIVPRFLVVRYTAAAGVWYENEFEAPPVTASFPVVPDPRYSAWPQWLELVTGESANKKIPDGHYAHVVDAREMGYIPKDRDWVVVERVRLGGHLRERTIKQVEIRPDGEVFLCPRSTSEKWQEPVALTVPGEEGDTLVEIAGLVIGSYDPDF